MTTVQLLPRDLRPGMQVVVNHPTQGYAHKVEILRVQKADDRSGVWFVDIKDPPAWSAATLDLHPKTQLRFADRMTVVVNLRERDKEGIGRNDGEGRLSHIYVLGEDDSYLPMCRQGWNRSDGAAFSIFRGHSGTHGTCKNCCRRYVQGLPPVESEPGSHKTRYL